MGEQKKVPESVRSFDSESETGETLKLQVLVAFIFLFLFLFFCYIIIIINLVLCQVVLGYFGLWTGVVK